MKNISCNGNSNSLYLKHQKNINIKVNFILIISAIKDLCNRYSLPIILLFWLLCFCLHLNVYGIVTGLEAKKYIAEAENLINDKGLSAARFWFYSITIFIIALSLKIKIGFAGAVLIQSLFNLLVTLYFYKSLKLVFQKSSLLPMLIVYSIIGFSPYSSWNVFLFTESIFYSSILLLISGIIQHNYTQKKITVFVIIFALLVTILARPLGILFIPAILFYSYGSLLKKVRIVIVPAIIIGLFTLLYVTNIIFTTTSNVTITLSAKEGCVVCGIIPKENSELRLLNGGSPLQQLYYYISNNFSHFVKLSLARLKAFFFMIRSYYSMGHNIFILIFMIPLYILSAISLLIKKQKEYTPVYYFIISSIITFTIVVMLQCDDYHNRFILGLFPFLLILSSKTLSTL